MSSVSLYLYFFIRVYIIVFSCGFFVKPCIEEIAVYFTGFFVYSGKWIRAYFQTRKNCGIFISFGFQSTNVDLQTTGFAD